MTDIAPQPSARELHFFLTESFWIEGQPAPFQDHLYHTRAFLGLDDPTMGDLAVLVGAYQSDARIRDQVGVDVSVGDYVAPPGGPEIPERLVNLLGLMRSGVIDSWALYTRYEALHPWTDGNGRTGRTLWAWRRLREGCPLNQAFLNPYHYQTLERYAR